jgi:hypothetical protein
MVDFENPQIFIRIAIRIRIQPGAQNHVLRGAARDRGMERIFRIPAPRCQKSATGAHFSASRSRRYADFSAGDGHRQRIVEHARKVQQLV